MKHVVDYLRSLSSASEADAARALRSNGINPTSDAIARALSESKPNRRRKTATKSKGVTNG